MYRDKVVSTHPLEKQPLSSYPLKIAAMHHTANTRDMGIYTDMLGALRLLDPEVNNSVDGLCSFMIKDDPIIKEGEVFHSWSRLIADDIQRKAQKMAYLKKGFSLFVRFVCPIFMFIFTKLCVSVAVDTYTTDISTTV